MKNPSVSVELSELDMQLLKMMVEDKVAKEMAVALQKDVRTVKYHLGRLYAKLGVTGRLSAVVLALRQGIVK